MIEGFLTWAAAHPTALIFLPLLGAVAVAIIYGVVEEICNPSFSADEHDGEG